MVSARWPLVHNNCSRSSQVLLHWPKLNDVNDHSLRDKQSVLGAGGHFPSSFLVINSHCSGHIEEVDLWDGKVPLNVIISMAV